MASIRRIPAATAPSETILKCQISPVFFTWVPPQSSMDFPKRTERTVSPYFSPNKLIAPSAIASSFGVFRFSSKGNLPSILRFTKSSTSCNSSGVNFEKCEKSKRKYSAFTALPFCSTWLPKTSLKAWCNKWVAVWLLSVNVLWVWSTTALNDSLICSGKFLAKWMIKLFSFFVSRM